MDLNLFATQLIQTGQKGPSSALSGSGFLGVKGGLGTANFDFWNAILGNIAEEATETKTDGKQTGQDVVRDKIKKETVDLALLQLALLGQDPEKSLDEKLSELRIERLANTTDNRVEQLKKLISHLTNGLPASDDNGNIEDLVTRLEKRLEKLESKLDAFRTGDFGDEGAPFKLLIATGLNPAQLTKITQRIEEVEAKLGRELTVDDLIAGVGNIIPAPGDDDHEFSTTDALGLILEKSDKEKIAEKENTDKKTSDEASVTAQIEEQIGNIITGNTDISIDNNTSGEVAVSGDSNTSIKPDGAAVAAANTPATDNRSVSLQHFINKISSLRNFPFQVIEGGEETASLPNTPVEGLKNARSNAEFNALFKGVNNIKASLENIPAPTVTAKTNASAPAALSNVILPAVAGETTNSYTALSEALGFDIHTGTPFNATSQAAHIATSATQAGQTHPATQMVAAHIAKSAQSGESKSITLQLDPPDLGRVEVRLEFGHEKSVKAHLVIEKPETYLMLQRDAAALERALQNAGLETGSDSLNYEMASQDYNFNGDREGQSSGGGTGSSGTDAEESDIEIIETTMTWDVDPETGHVHYSLLA
jgi:flagellar hook-length control protein FliK